jgi:DNA-binding transcriptional LysR family regulator
VTPAAISDQIAALEADLGVSLLPWQQEQVFMP